MFLLLYYVLFIFLCVFSLFCTFSFSFFFFFNDTATTEIYTLSLHDALPIFGCSHQSGRDKRYGRHQARVRIVRSEEHTSELQSLAYLVCRLLLEKKKKKIKGTITPITNKNEVSRVQ